MYSSLNTTRAIGFDSEAVFARMARYGDRPAVLWRGQETSYSALDGLIEDWIAEFARRGIGAGSVCAFVGDYSPRTCALFFALMKAKAVAVPLTYAVSGESAEFLKLAEAQWLISVDRGDEFRVEALSSACSNSLLRDLRETARSGLIVFTSGSTGQPKAILHDSMRVLSRFAKERRAWRAVQFLMMDHFGGFNTLMSIMTCGGAAVCLENRNPEAVCQEIERWRADLLPTTPTFLNLLIATRAWERYDLSSIRMITYGTELMSNSTLEKVCGIFPNAEVKQTYGLSELGVLRSQSPDKHSVWLRIGGEGFETKVVDGTLWIRSQSSMLGYLNAPTPIDADGWMSTGDQVEEKDGLIRFLGRKREVINVGGQKVFPIEVETVLLRAANVAEATAYGVSLPLLGQVVAARVSLLEPEEMSAAIDRLREHCRQHLAKFKIPMRFEVGSSCDQTSTRFKKIRNIE